jgi:hypothetical protein
LWDVDPQGKPRALKEDYFTKFPETGAKIDFEADFHLPFIKKYIEAIHSVRSDLLVFFEPIPNEDPPKFSEKDRQMENIVYAPHWYDLDSVFKKVGFYCLLFHVSNCAFCPL